MEPGDRIGDWIVEDPIASGGFGVVHRARHKDGRPAALKVLHAELAASDEAVERFEREARAVSRIRHPNVVELLELGRLPGGRPYLVMELLHGTDLGRHLAAHGRLSPDDAVELLAPLCDALAAVHAAGIVHRDVKDSNVFLADDGAGGRRVVLLDFGVAKLLDPETTELTTARHVVGTPACMAPEQIVGAAVDARTDVYALGALAYHMMSGSVPFGADSPTVLQYLHQYARRPLLSSKVDVPPALDQVIVRAMATLPEARYSGPLELLAALRGALAGAPASAVRATPSLGVHVWLRVAPEAMEAPDDALLADLDDLLAAAARSLRTAGFVPAVETGDAALFVLPLPADDERRARRAGIEAAMRVHREVVPRDRRVRVAVAVHADEALLDGGRVEGGAITRLASWVPEDDAAIVVTEAASAGLE